MAHWPGKLTLEEIQQSFREIWEKVQPLLSGNPDLNGRRFTNAGDAIQKRDFLTLGQGDARYEIKKDALAAFPEARQKSVRIDAYANRGAANLFTGKLFEASDRNYVAWASDGVSWIYAYGIHQRTQSQLAVLAATLGTSDAGYPVNVTDFSWKLQWTGSAWSFGAGQAGGGFIQGFSAAPLAGAWQLCDGTATTFLKADGTTGNFTTPNLSGHYAKFAAAYTDTAAAGGATTAVSAGTPSGTVSQPTFTGDALAIHQHELPMQTPSNLLTRFTDPATFGTGTSRAAISQIDTVADTTLAAVTKSEAVSAGTPTGTVSQPTFTGNALATHSHGPNTLELARTELLAYFRR